MTRHHGTIIVIPLRMNRRINNRGPLTNPRFRRNGKVKLTRIIPRFYRLFNRRFTGINARIKQNGGITLKTGNNLLNTMMTHLKVMRRRDRGINGNRTLVIHLTGTVTRRIMRGEVINRESRGDRKTTDGNVVHYYHPYSQ